MNKKHILTTSLPGFPGLIKVLYAAVLTFCISGSAIRAQEKKFCIPNTQYIELTNELTGRDHELIVVLPPGYNSSPEKKYPVLYYMDAYWDLPLFSAIHGQLVYDNVIPEMIMVGFSYPGENANYDELRRRDLTPSADMFNPSTSGQAPEFLQFIKEKVIPLIDSRFRTLDGERAIGGNSLGGLFTLYAMYESPALFKRFIASSPAVIWDNFYINKYDSVYQNSKDKLQARLFLSYGTDEFPPYRDPIVSYQEKLKKMDYPNLSLMNYSIEGERHSGVKSVAFSRGLIWVFKDMAPEGPSGLAKSFQ